jgi:hypothetical protein
MLTREGRIDSANAPGKGKSDAYLSVTCKINLQSFGVVLEAKRRHGKQDIFAIDSLSLLLLTFLRSLINVRDNIQSDEGMESEDMMDQ